MIVQRFIAGDGNGCLRVFDSNGDRYFAPEERLQFVQFLDKVPADKVPADDEYYTIKTDERIIACGGFGKRGKLIVLTWGMVLREMHGRGVGTRLVRFRLERIREAHPECEVLIQTSQHTEPFYAKMGFEKLETTKDGFGEGIDLVSMKLRKRGVTAPRQLTE